VINVDFKHCYFRSYFTNSCVSHVAVSDRMLRSALFRDFTQGRMVGFLGLEDEIDSLYRNVDNKLPFYAARNPKRAQISFIPRQKPEITQNKSCQFDVASKF